MTQDIFTLNRSKAADLYGRHWPAHQSPPKAVMMIAHGFGEHCGRYAPMAEFLNARGIAVVSVDLQGHGKSPTRRGAIKSYEQLRTDLRAMIAKTQALYDDVPLILFGHSMGGGLVLDYGLENPDGVEAFITSAPLIKLSHPPSAGLQRVAKFLAKLTPSLTTAQPIDGAKVSSLPAEQDAYEADPLNHGRVSFALAGDLINVGDNIAARAEGWNAPLLLYHARGDQLTQFSASEDFAARAQNTRFVAFDDCEHEMHNDTTRAQSYALLSEFILGQIS